MISERTLRRWRREALKYKAKREDYPEELKKLFDEGVRRILFLTQELLDQHLIRKV